MSISLVQSTTNVSTGTNSITATLTSFPASSNILVAAIAQPGIAASLISPSGWRPIGGGSTSGGTLTLLMRTVQTF